MVEQRSPKPRAEGSSPSAPAKNREASIVLASLFFVSAHKDSATRCGCAPRSACRGALVACGALPRTDRGGSRDKSDVYLCLFSHPSAPAAPPSSTQNAPGFAFFGLNRVLFALLARKIFRIFFVHSVDMAHKLKSLVIPHSLVVSFLTWYSSVS